MSGFEMQNWPNKYQDSEEMKLEDRLGDQSSTLQTASAAFDWGSLD